MKNIKDWADAHKPLIAILVKVAATLGSLAAVGGPILLGVAAFMKMKVAIAAIGTITSGPIGIFIVATAAVVVGLKKWIEHSEKVREENEKLKASLLNEDEIASRIDIVTKRIEELKWQLETIGKSSFLGGDVIANQIKALEAELKALTETEKELATETEELATEVEVLGTAFPIAIKGSAGLGAGLKAAAVNIREFSEGVKDTVTALQNDFAKSMDAVINKIYEFTHTDYEVTLKGINEEYDNLIEQAKKAFLSESELADAINAKRSKAIRD